MNPQQWTEEDREEIAEAIVDGIIRTMTLEEMRAMCWDALFHEVVGYPWGDMWGYAEMYAPDLKEYYDKVR